MSLALRTKYLLKKYLDNHCSAVETDELFELLNDEQNLRTIESDLKALWDNTEENSNQQSNERYHKFSNRVHLKKTQMQFPLYKKFKWAAAAAVILMMSFTGYYFYANKNLNLDQKSHHQLSLQPTIKKIILPDGSIVILNKGSELNYPAAFTKENRTVSLIGEAYFDIKHDAKRPFLVHTGALTTRVLGTAFNIKSNAKESLIEVTVSRGKVAVSNPKQTLAVLLPNQKISYHSNSGAYTKASADAATSTLWKEEDLVIDNLTMEEAAKKIEERYSTTIVISNEKILNCKFTAHFLNTTGLEQVIKVICKLNQLDYSVNEKGVYTLSGNGCD